MKELLDADLGTPPLSTVDVERVIRRVKRKRVIFRGVVASVGVFAVVLGIGLSARPVEVVPAALPAPPSPSSAAAFPELSAKRLREAMGAAMESAAPGTQWVYMVDVPGELALPDGLPQVREGKGSTDFSARSGLQNAVGKGGFYLSVYPTNCPLTSGPTACHTVVTCERIYAECAVEGDLTVWTDKPSKGYVFYGAQIRVTPDYYLSVLLVNYFGGDGSKVSATTPVLTREQTALLVKEIARALR